MGVARSRNYAVYDIVHVPLGVSSSWTIKRMKAIGRSASPKGLIFFARLPTAPKMQRPKQ